MNNSNISKERKRYLKNRRKKQYLILLAQIAILVIFLGVWEIAANKGIIDSFITSKPSRIFDTFIGSKSKLKQQLFDTIITSPITVKSSILSVFEVITTFRLRLLNSCCKK